MALVNIHKSLSSQTYQFRASRSVSLITLLLTAMLWGGTIGAPPAVTTPAQEWWGDGLGCRTCHPSLCPALPQQGCQGATVKDACDCCTICDVTNATGAGLAPSIKGGESCASITCPRQQQCFLNIQGLPLCRCPTPYLCRRQPRREVCGRDGVTYRSRCYVQVAECAQHRKIRVAHRGPCYTTGKGKKKHPAADRVGGEVNSPPEVGRRKADRVGGEVNSPPEVGRRKKGPMEPELYEPERKDDRRKDGRQKGNRKQADKKKQKRRRRKNKKNKNRDRERSRAKRRFLLTHHKNPNNA